MSSTADADQRHAGAIDIDLHVIELNPGDGEFTRLRQCLSEREQQRAAQFVHKRHQSRWICARARMRQILAEYTGTPVDAIVFSRARNGKPFIESDQNMPPVHFNLSHSGELALLAVSRNQALGVDVERLRPLRDFERVAARFFSEAEQHELNSVPDASKTLAFYCGWTRKEAIIKATGEGLSASLDSFDVTLTPGAEARVTGMRRGDSQAEDWTLLHLEPKPGYVGALALVHAGAIRLRTTP